MIRIATFAIAFVSLFIFPWPVSFVAIALASIFLPFAGVALGVLADLIYFVPGSAFLPYASLFGLFCTVLSLLMQRFVKTRIMGE
jgi:hypothetical protein